MNQPIKTFSTMLLFICLALSITNCSLPNKIPITVVSVIDHGENTTTTPGLDSKEQIDLTVTPIVKSSTHTVITVSSDSELSVEYLQGNQTCIGKFSEFAYSGAMNTKSSIQQPVLPLAPWEEVVEFSENINKEETYYLALARINTGELEIWIYDYVTKKITIFNPDSQEQHVISAESIDYPGMTFSPVFALSDGTVYGGSFIYGENNELLYDSFPPLSKYNEETQQFEIPEDMSTISLHKVDYGNPQHPLILLDKNDNFWIFVQYDGLYQYDTHTGEMNEIMHTPDMEFRNGVMDQQGGIYFNRSTIGYYPIEGLKFGEIIYFNPELVNFSPLSIPDQKWPTVNSLFFDPEERLWTDISGYRDKDGKWTLLHNNIDEYFIKFNMLQSWHVPSVEIQTSDGRFWVERRYSNYNQGTAWFDPETGEGCWFTSYNSTIVEDANNTLWFEADGKLYKNELQP